MTASDLSLGARWLGARLKLTLRNPRAVVFTLAFPLLLIVLFSGLNGNAEVSAMGAAGKVRFAQFYTPSIAMFSLIAACYTSLVVGVVSDGWQSVGYGNDVAAIRSNVFVARGHVRDTILKLQAPDGSSRRVNLGPL